MSLLRVRRSWNAPRLHLPTLPHAYGGMMYSGSAGDGVMSVVSCSGMSGAAPASNAASSAAHAAMLLVSTPLSHGSSAMAVSSIGLSVGVSTTHWDFIGSSQL